MTVTKWKYKVFIFYVTVIIWNLSLRSLSGFHEEANIFGSLFSQGNKKTKTFYLTILTSEIQQASMLFMGQLYWGNSSLCSDKKKKSMWTPKWTFVLATTDRVNVASERFSLDFVQQKALDVSSNLCGCLYRSYLSTLEVKGQLNDSCTTACVDQTALDHLQWPLSPCHYNENYVKW